MAVLISNHACSWAAVTAGRCSAGAVPMLVDLGNAVAYTHHHHHHGSSVDSTAATSLTHRPVRQEPKPPQPIRHAHT
jgi:hypothetical protein